MNKLLQIDILVAQGTDDHVCANAFFHRYIAHWIFELGVSRVVTKGFANLVSRRLYYLR